MVGPPVPCPAPRETTTRRSAGGDPPPHRERRGPPSIPGRVCPPPSVPSAPRFFSPGSFGPPRFAFVAESGNLRRVGPLIPLDRDLALRCDPRLPAPAMSPPRNAPYARLRPGGNVDFFATVIGYFPALPPVDDERSLPVTNAAASLARYIAAAAISSGVPMRPRACASPRISSYAFLGRDTPAAAPHERRLDAAGTDAVESTCSRAWSSAIIWSCRPPRTWWRSRRVVADAARSRRSTRGR